VVADFGTAVTIDLVDDRGVFLGGTIIPGFEIAAKALHEHTAQLPKVEVKRPELPWGKNTEEAINAGLFYSATGTLEEIVRKYSEKIGTWPRTIITGTGAKIIKDDCPFVDSYVPNLVIKGIALAYRKQIDRYAEEETDEQEE
jgi:type III pantothenate kinase